MRTLCFRLALPITAMLVLACAKKEESSAEAKPKPARKQAESKAESKPHRTVRGDEPHPEDAEVRFDVAFVIDTTGSMKKLIETARDRIRGIAQFVGTGKPTPSVRFAIVAYRDRGEEYVTLSYGFSPNIDKAEQALGALTAVGGRDAPEHVVAGLRAGIEGLDWDPKADLKFLFLVGDAPPHLDYGDDSDVEPILKAAKAESITIGAIPLGPMSDQGKMFFHKVASATGGPSEGITAEAELESTVTTTLAEHAAKVGVTYQVQ